MKIALVTDTHFGARNDSLAFHDFFAKFYSQCFFPYLRAHGIKKVIHLGDVFDRRKYINYISLQRCRDYFFEPLRDYESYVITGNHDIPYKNTLQPNANRLNLGEYKNITVIDEPTEVDGIAMMPWICSDNYIKAMEVLEKSNAPILCGHLELSGFEMYKGSFIEHGYDAGMFKRFEQVLSGHYHHRSTRGNVTYLGTPYEITWADWDDLKGFHILDTELRSLEFIPNPHRMFHKIHYDDQVYDLEQIMDFDGTHINGSYVKVIVHTKNNPYYFDKFMDKLEKLGPLNIQTVDDNLNLNLEDDEDLVSEAEDTLTVLRGFVNGLEGDVDKKTLDRVLTDLYNTALTVSV